MNKYISGHVFMTFKVLYLILYTYIVVELKCIIQPKYPTILNYSIKLDTRK